MIIQMCGRWLRGAGLALCVAALAGCVPGAPLLQTESAAVTAPVSALPTPALTVTTTATTTVAITATAAATGTLPVRLVMPALKLDVPVTEMKWEVVKTAGGGSQSVWLIPENAGGHAANSAALGQPGNVVISGHNNIYGRVFLKLSQAWPARAFTKIDQFSDSSDTLKDQTITLYGADGRRFDYRVTGFYRVKDSADVPLAQRLANARFIEPTDHAQLTITTCWPPWSNEYRLVLIGEPLMS